MKVWRVRSGVFVAAFVAVWVLTPTAGAANLIALEQKATSVAADNGRVVWSSYDQATRRYQLRTRANGVTSTVPVRTRTVPFDVDVGPRSGGTGEVAVYSRCHAEASGTGPWGLPEYKNGEGCRLFSYDFLTGREQLLEPPSVERSSFLPAIWQNTVVYATVGGPARSKAYIPALIALSLRTHHTRRLRGGTVGRYTWDSTRRRYIGGPGVTSIDVRGHSAAFTWDYLPTRPCESAARSELRGSELWLETTTARRRLLKRRCEPTTFSDVTLVGEDAFFFETQGTSAFQWFFSRFHGGGFSRRRAPDGLVSVAADITGTYYVSRTVGGFGVYSDGAALGSTETLIYP